MYQPIRINNLTHRSGDKDGDKLQMLVIPQSRITEMYKEDDGTCVIEVRANEYSFDDKDKVAYDYFEVTEVEFERVLALIIANR